MLRHTVLREGDELIWLDITAALLTILITNSIQNVFIQTFFTVSHITTYGNYTSSRSYALFLYTHYDHENTPQW